LTSEYYRNSSWKGPNLQFGENIHASHYSFFSAAAILGHWLIGIVARNEDEVQPGDIERILQVSIILVEATLLSLY